MGIPMVGDGRPDGVVWGVEATGDGLMGQTRPDGQAMIGKTGIRGGKEASRS